MIPDSLGLIAALLLVLWAMVRAMSYSVEHVENYLGGLLIWALTLVLGVGALIGCCYAAALIHPGVLGLTPV